MDIFTKKQLKKIIPNAITSANLLCGCLAVVEISNGQLVNASFLVLAGAFFDFFDGMFARLLKVTSPIGAQLDSLADMITFGFVPALIAFEWLNSIEPSRLNYFAFSIAVFSAVRLAKFNIDDRQTSSFIGVPTPANALLWISLPFIQWQVSEDIIGMDLSPLLHFFQQTPVILGLIALFSFLLIAELPLLSLKFSKLNWKGNEFRFLLVVFSLILFALFCFAAIPFILILYIILSIIQTTYKKAR